MNLATFYDTETNGLPDWSTPSDAPHQPHIVQLAAILVDLDTRKELASVDIIIRPDGWVIPQEVANLHGITTEMALDLGVPESVALDMLEGLWLPTRTRIAHNEPFDARIVRIAQHRFGRSDPQLESWKGGMAQCTQKLASPIMKLPPTEKMKAARRFHYKSANLAEAHMHFLGRPLENAHSALADCRGCKDVFFAIQDLPPEQLAA